MPTNDVDVLATGAVLLGDQVTCDGFVYGHPLRVQTHIHFDHMHDFDTSKGFQTILMSHPTFELLVAYYNADLPVRQNIRALPYDRPEPLSNAVVTLVPSGHMLGAVQVLVEEGGTTRRLGYSGDFRWPLEEPIQVDVLVVDSTYGSPKDRRDYTQERVEEELVSMVLSGLKRGSVYIKAHRGTLQRALQVLAGELDVPLLGSKRLIQEVNVYRRHGYLIDPVLDIKSAGGKEKWQAGQCVVLYGTGDGVPTDLRGGMSIDLSAYMSKSSDPCLWFSERSCRLAMSNHADFEGTVEYVRATNAREVITDNTRGHGVELAIGLRSAGIDARPSSNARSDEWGS